LIIVLAIILFLRYINTEKGRYNVDYFIYKNKIFGKLLYLMDFSKIIRSLEISLSNKVRLQDALEISKNSISNTYMLDLIERGINNIYSGKSWIAPFEENGFMNNIVIEILRISTTEKGSMSVEKAIEYVDYEIDRQIDYLIKKLPEVSNVIVGITLFLFTLIVVIPCVQIYLGGYLFM
jgi:type II secretory pathway component PulF